MEKSIVEIVLVAAVSLPVVQNQLLGGGDIKLRQDQAVQAQHIRLVIRKFEFLLSVPQRAVPEALSERDHVRVLLKTDAFREVILKTINNNVKTLKYVDVIAKKLSDTSV